MRRIHVGLMLFAWLALGLPAHAVMLRYSPKVGETIKHKVSMAGRTSAVVEGMGETMRMELSGAMQYTEKALSETPDTVRVETRVTGGKFTMSVGGQSESQQAPKGKFVADMDRRGRLVKAIEADFGGKSGAQDFMTGGTGSLSNLTTFAAFPEGDVKVGDTWSDEIKIPATQGGPEVNLSLTSRLLDLADFQGRKCAKIRTTFKGPMSFSAPAGSDDPGNTMEAALQGDLIWYYDYENSIYVSGEGSVGMDMKMSVSGPEMPGLPVTTKMLMNVKLSLAK